MAIMGAEARAVFDKMKWDDEEAADKTSHNKI